jgi:type I restriction enzyme R subunit
VGAEPRIASVAADLVEHFEERGKAQTGKAMIIGMSREICVHLYNEIVRLRPDWHSEDTEKGMIKIVMTGSASDKAILRPHIHSSQAHHVSHKRHPNERHIKSSVSYVRDITHFDVFFRSNEAPKL